MSRRSSYHHLSREKRGARPFVVFLFIASFGILFAGCAGPDAAEDDAFVFTEDDVARYRELADDARDQVTGSGAQDAPYLEPLESGSGSSKDDEVVLDLTLVDTYQSMRAGTSGTADMYQVSNEFLNVRSQPATTAESLARLEFGDSVHVVQFLNGTWAKVKLPDAREGYVSHRYLAKVTSDERLADEKKAFEGMYYVSFGFVNLRREANAGSEKLAEIPGQTILKPTDVQGDWGKVTHDGKEGYVSMSYLSPFMPNFIVRQETYTLPVLHYRLSSDRTIDLLQQMTEHATRLRSEGVGFMTMRQFYDVLVRQQQRDVRLDPNKVVIAISGITPENVDDVSDALTANGIPATLFLETRHVGLTGITEKRLMSLMANGFDIQSATHSGDDLRALTNAQVQLEMQQSRKILEDFTKKTIFAVAYPQGGVNDRVMQLAAEAGYLLGLGDDADRAFNRGQLLRIPSLVIFPSMTIDEVVKFAKGS